uniref:Helix-turn-helix domain-containing protein n=1 Tax=Escherichia coli TaxID=562 RepID=A0A3G4RXB3_ECOLX|nr:helix-turn-helix domain-containing protein [Escherichia coli]
MYIGTEEQRKKRLKELEKLNKESESDPKITAHSPGYQKGWEGSENCRRTSREL